MNAIKKLLLLLLANGQAKLIDKLMDNLMDNLMDKLIDKLMDKLIDKLKKQANAQADGLLLNMIPYREEAGGGAGLAAILKRKLTVS